MTSLLKIRFILAACAWTSLSGCTWLMMSDFDNGREIAILDIGKVQLVTKTLDLPPGNASISFVVPGYDCKRPLDGTLGIVIRGANRVIMQGDVSLSKLTWPTVGNGECFPVGYLALDDVELTQPLKFILGRDEGPISIALKIKPPARLGMSMSVWVVYNSRLPVERMLNSKGPWSTKPKNAHPENPAQGDSPRIVADHNRDKASL